MEAMADPHALDDIAASLGSLKSLTSKVSGSLPEVITVAAVSILIVYVLWHLVDSVLQDKRDPDGIFKDIALMLFFSYLAKHTPELINALAGAGDYIGNGIKNWLNSGGVKDALDAAFGSGGSGPDFTAMKTELEAKNLFVLLFDSFLYGVLGRLVLWIICIIAKISIFTVKIEVIIRTIFFPLAVASIPEGGLQGPGGRYIKHFLGCFLQFGVILAALKAYPIITAAAITTAGESLVIAIAASGFATVGICMKASSLANEIAGA